MHAIVREAYGPPETVRVHDLDVPDPGDGGVLVRVRAAGVNRGDVLAVEGIPYATRLTTGLTRPSRRGVGSDVAGVVEAVGPGVTDLRPGDEVFGWAEGAFAERARTPATMLVPKPANLTFEQAAAVPTAAVTAFQALERGPRPGEGTDVLVLGASGSVGSFVVQLARTSGARVTGVTSTRNVELVRSLGAADVVDYTREDLAGRAGAFDLVVDLVGGQSLRAARHLVRPGGGYVVVGGQNPRSLTGMSRFAAAVLLNPFVPQRVRPLFATQDRSTLEQVSALIGEGRVLPVIDATYDLRATPEALRYVAAGHARGRVVVTP